MTVLIIGGAFQGKRKIAEKLYPELPKVLNLHEIVRKCIAEGRDSMTLLDELRGHVVTCDEIGCGVVPIERKLARGRGKAVLRSCRAGRRGHSRLGGRPPVY